MKKIPLMLILMLSASSVWARRPERTSENTPKLAALLNARPQLDLNKDGILTFEEARNARSNNNPGPEDRDSRKTPPARVDPTYSNISYGEHPSMKLDFWKAEGDEPTPLFVWIHGGGFRSGDKAGVNPMLLKAFLDAGVSVASINYRLSGIAPYPAQMHDSARAIQFLRSRSKEWNLDPARLAVGGGSAGSGISQWLAFHDDLADPESSDPVEHFSTRVSCALALNMQSTYDPRVIKEIIPGKAFNDSALKPFYGLPDDWNWETATIDPALDALIKDASPIHHLTPDDSPVFIFHSERTRTDGNIHHPNFGTHLESAMREMGIECIRKTDADYAAPTDSSRDMAQFTLQHLGVDP